MPTTSHDPVLIDEASRLQRHEQVKGAVESRVQDEIRQKSANGDDAQVQVVAGHLRQKALSEVIETEDQLARGRRLARVSQIADYVFFLIYGLIGLEIVLELLGARQSSGFKQLLDAMTRPLLAPFKGLLWDPAVGASQLMLSYVVALGVYLLLHRAVNGLLRLFVSRKATV